MNMLSNQTFNQTLGIKSDKDCLAYLNNLRLGETEWISSCVKVLVQKVSQWKQKDLTVQMILD